MARTTAMSLADLRVLRLALGTALCLWFSQAAAWPMSFIAPVLVTVLLGQPMPAPDLKKSAGLVLVVLLALNGGLLLLPAIYFYPAVGVLLLGLAFFWTFWFTARGGSMLLGTLATAGIAVATAVGTVSLDAALSIVSSMAISAVAALAFVRLAHLLLPDARAAPEPAAIAGPATAPPAPATARRSALRSTLIVLPIGLWFLLSPASASYVPVMIKVAAMGQQATNEDTRLAARSLIVSTLVGGAGAIIGWNVLRIHPSLVLYALLVGLAGLVIGRHVFRGRGLAADAETWSYGYLTMIVILAPAVLDSATSVAAGVKFLDRLLMFGGATLYAVAAVYVADAFLPLREKIAGGSRLS